MKNEFHSVPWIGSFLSIFMMNGKECCPKMELPFLTFYSWMLTKDHTTANTDSSATTYAGTGTTTGGTICIKDTNPSIRNITDD